MPSLTSLSKTRTRVPAATAAVTDHVEAIKDPRPRVTSHSASYKLHVTSYKVTFVTL